MAARELRDGFGIKLVERFIPPTPPTPKNTDNNKTKPRPKFANEQTKTAPTKPAPKPPEPVIPKL